MAKLLKATEFALFAGVTVRTLHYYDRLGLLKPSGRTEAGYRLYREHDLERLEEIVVLKFLGMPLKEISKLLASRNGDVRGTLRAQRLALIERRKRLDIAIEAIQRAEGLFEAGRDPDVKNLKEIIQVIEKQNDPNWMMKYYSEEARAKVEERKALWSPELQERVSRQWAELFKDIAAAKDLDPASPEARALADRWSELLRGFTGGDPQISEGLKSMYADQANWPSGMQNPVPASAYDFIRRVKEARESSQ